MHGTISGAEGREGEGRGGERRRGEGTSWGRDQSQRNPTHARTVMPDGPDVTPSCYEPKSVFKVFICSFDIKSNLKHH